MAMSNTFQPYHELMPATWLAWSDYDPISAYAMEHRCATLTYNDTKLWASDWGSVMLAPPAMDGPDELEASSRDHANDTLMAYVALLCIVSVSGAIAMSSACSKHDGVMMSASKLRRSSGSRSDRTVRSPLSQPSAAETVDALFFAPGADSLPAKAPGITPRAALAHGRRNRLRSTWDGAKGAKQARATKHKDNMARQHCNRLKQPRPGF